MRGWRRGKGWDKERSGQARWSSVWGRSRERRKGKRNRNKRVEGEEVVQGVGVQGREGMSVWV